MNRWESMSNALRSGIDEARVEGQTFYAFNQATIMLASVRYGIPSAPWTERDGALLAFYWKELEVLVNRWGNNDARVLKGALIVWSSAHPEYEVWMDGEQLK